MFVKPKRPVDKVFLHCSASDRPEHDNVRTIEQWHLARKPPFKEIGYHFYINKQGKVYLGRDVEKAPAAQAGFNAGTIAICCGGLKDFPKVQMDALKALCEQINRAYDGKLTFHGHREVDKGKTCPVYDYRKVLGLDAKGRMA